MDTKEFLALLSKVAEWEVPKVELDGIQRRKMAVELQRQTREKHYDEFDTTDQDDVDCDLGSATDPTTDPTHNPTLNIRLKSVFRATVCEDCGRDCPQGRSTEKNIYKTEEGLKVWRERCKTCQMTRDPFTGKFSLNGTYVTKQYRCYVFQTAKIDRPKNPPGRPRKG